MRAFTAALDLRRYVGRWSLRSASHAGRFAFMLMDLVRGILEWRVWFPRMMEQTMAVGYGSLFIVLLVAGFAGAVTSLQAGYQFTGQLPCTWLGHHLRIDDPRAGSRFNGTHLAGRIGARYAAELGSMRVTEQIDALESLGRSPVTHLLLPRILAGLIAIPALVMLANAFGVVVGYITAQSSLGLTYADFEFGARYFFRPLDLYYSAIKSFAFAGAVTIIPCYIGFKHPARRRGGRPGDDAGRRGGIRHGVDARYDSPRADSGDRAAKRSHRLTKSQAVEHDVVHDAWNFSRSSAIRPVPRISFVRIVSSINTVTDAATTACVVARPTPSAPCWVLSRCSRNDRDRPGERERLDGRVVQVSGLKK